MKSKNLLYILFILILVITVSACSNANEYDYTDPFTFTIDQEAKDNYIANIGVSINNEKLVYFIEQENCISYVVYEFEKGIAVTKTCYHFFNDIEKFRDFFNSYNISLDGSYNEVIEDILLISTKYTNLNEKTYGEIYTVVMDSYTLL